MKQSDGGGARVQQGPNLMAEHDATAEADAKERMAENDMEAMQPLQARLVPQPTPTRPAPPANGDDFWEMGEYGGEAEQRIAWRNQHGHTQDGLHDNSLAAASGNEQETRAREIQIVKDDIDSLAKRLHALEVDMHAAHAMRIL